LNMAEPMMVPRPMELAGPKVSPSDVKSSGADEPACERAVFKLASG